MKDNYILIVEDNNYDKDLYKKIFAELGVQNELVFTKDGKEAINYLRSREEIPFIIISDINMPAMNGMDFLKAIQVDKRLKMLSVPFIFMTSSDNQGEIQSAFGLNAHGYFVKPWDMESLKKTINLILEYWEKSELPEKL